MKTKKEELQAELTRLNALRKQVKEKLKALPVLEVGKWYLIDCEVYYSLTARNAIVFNNGEDYSYGFNFEGEFVNEFNLSNYRESIIRELTPQEVEQALIEEAKMMGIIEGATVKDHYNNTFKNINGTYVYRDNKLAYGGCFIFQNGKWAAIIEQDKFAELKEAHSTGAVIEFRSKYTNFEWEVTLDPAWGDFSEYRIKPEEKPKVGDVCKFYYVNDSEFTIGLLDKEVDGEFPYVSTMQARYKYAKTLTQQEAIDLLFNKGAN